MVANRDGLIIITGGTDPQSHYLGNVPYDVVKAASSRLVVALAHELRPHGVAAVGVYPGFTRTEAVVAAFAAQDTQPPPETHSPEFVGRAVASVLADPDPMRLSGTGAQAADLAFPLSAIRTASLVFDVVALPALTPLVLAARAEPKRVISGAEVIALQAAEQFEKYTGVRPTAEQVREASEVSRA